MTKLFFKDFHASHLEHYFITHDRGAVAGAVLLGFLQHGVFIQTGGYLYDGLQHGLLDGGVGVVQVDEQLVQSVVYGGAGVALAVGAALHEHDQRAADRDTHLVVAVI